VSNGMFYTRGSKEDYDSWEKLGNLGRGWEDLRKWFIKVCISLQKKVMGVKEGGWSKRNFECTMVSQTLLTESATG
jgi:choline dehydrogenase-like flavoprotein